MCKRIPLAKILLEPVCHVLSSKKADLAVKFICFGNSFCRKCKFEVATNLWLQDDDPKTSIEPENYRLVKPISTKNIRKQFFCTKLNVISVKYCYYNRVLEMEKNRYLTKYCPRVIASTFSGFRSAQLGMERAELSNNQRRQYECAKLDAANRPGLFAAGYQ